MPYIGAEELLTLRTDLYKARTAMRAIKAKLEGDQQDPNLVGWPGVTDTMGPHTTILHIINGTLPETKPA